MNWELIAWLAFRAAYSFVFLNAAWKCGKDRAGIEWTISEARVLFGDAARLLGPAGILVMGAGGLSILFGVAGDVGGALLCTFLPLGALIHLKQRDRAKSLEKSITTGNATELADLSMTAQLGHYSSAMKNWSLLGPAIFFAIKGTGPASFFALWAQ